MKTSTLLMIAAGALPVWGLTTEPVEMPSAETAVLLAPPTCEVMPPEQKATFLPAAALLPADTDSFMVLSNVDRVLKRFGVDASPELAAVSGIESVAVGISDEAVTLLQTLVNQMGQGQMFGSSNMLLAEVWKTRATAPVKAVIQELLDGVKQATEQKIQNMAQQVTVKPVYFAVTVKPETIPAMQMMVGMLAGQLSQGDLRNMVECNGFKGVKLPGLSLSLPDEADRKVDAYLMYRMQGASLQVVLCGDPSQAKAPANAAESVLGRAELLNSRISRKLVAVISTSAAFNNICGGTPELDNAVDFVASVFRKLAADSPAFGRSGVYAADGLEFLKQQLNQLTPETDSPSQLYVWLDKSLHLEMVQDAAGMKFAPATMKQPAQLVNPDVAFYLESAPIIGTQQPDLPGILGAAGAVANGVVQTFEEPYRAKRQAELDKVLSYRSDVLALADAVTTLDSGLTGSSTVVVTVPSSTQTVEAAWYSPVSNRAALADAWQQMMVIGERMQARAGKSGKCEQPAPVVIGDATAYAMSIPAECQCPLAGMNPGVLVSNTDFVLGTTSAFNEAMLSTATGTMPLPGCVMQLRVLPAATAFCRLAADAEESGMPEKASELREMSQLFRSAANVVDRVVSGSIILNNRFHTRMDIILNK